MIRRLSGRAFQWLHRRFMESMTRRRTRHGIALSMNIEFAPLDEDVLWEKLDQALDLIHKHRPIWIRRMIRLDNSVHVRRIPGTRAMLTNDKFTILDPYLLANFLPAQIASSIIHEAVHATMRARNIPYDRAATGREEKACRAAELRFGRALRAAGVPGAEDVVERAVATLEQSDRDAGVTIDYNELRAIQLVTRLKDYPLPMWWKRRIGRRWGVLETSQWKRIMEPDNRAE